LAHLVGRGIGFTRSGIKACALALSFERSALVL